MNRDFNKKFLLLLSPLLIFAVLIVPYSLIKEAFIVDWLGCGCPKVDEYGNTIHSAFNANDFTRIFWFVISLCVTGTAAIFSRKIPKKLLWLRILYVALMLIVSLLIAAKFTQMMMVK
ncbi:MAG: hypothetical protein IJC50_08730 [Clostridia bacterium]|nr:hypothetical protein [Clostridia bacterium]